MREGKGLVRAPHRICTEMGTWRHKCTALPTTALWLPVAWIELFVGLVLVLPLLEEEEFWELQNLNEW